MKKFIIFVLFSFVINTKSLYSQSNDVQKRLDDILKQVDREYSNIKATTDRDFINIRDKVNAEFADIMKRTWEEFRVFQGIPAPKSPDPVKQPVVDPNKPPTAEPVPYDKVTPAPKPEPQPKPVVPIPIPEPLPPPPPVPVPPSPPPPPQEDIPTQLINRINAFLSDGNCDDAQRAYDTWKGLTGNTNSSIENGIRACREKSSPLPPPPPSVPTPTPPPPPAPAFSFLLYNTECKMFSLNETLRFSLSGVSEQNVAQAWLILSDSKYNALINECLNLRDKLNLSDWGYLQMLKAMSEKFLGKTSNEAVLLQMFILTQSGYKVRIARANNQLALLVPFRETVYEYSFLFINGERYYVINKDLKGQMLRIFNHEYPKEQYFSWQTKQPNLAVRLSSPRTFVSKRDSEINVTIQTNQNLIDYYNDYPLSSEWNLYTLTGLSEIAKQRLYPVLRRAIAGKSKVQAAGMLLAFMQTGFEYQTDDVQFGYERPFFADENFFYPYNDCEDRSILFAILVMELLNLEVVLLYCPGHLATAVHFPENVNGDYMMIDNKKFVVCDPTYIGASIGMAMNICKHGGTHAIKIKK